MDCNEHITSKLFTISKRTMVSQLVFVQMYKIKTLSYIYIYIYIYCVYVCTNYSHKYLSVLYLGKFLIFMNSVIHLYNHSFTTVNWIQNFWCIYYWRMFSIIVHMFFMTCFIRVVLKSVFCSCLCVRYALGTII